MTNCKAEHIQILKALFKGREIDGVLNLIRNHGRQAYLDKESSNFSRIQHDYADTRTGFMKWKGMLEAGYKIQSAQRLSL